MRRSISARIFGGFLLVMIAFGGVMGYTFYRMHRVGKQLTLMETGYLRLALVLGELNTIQGNLLNTVADPTAWAVYRRQIRSARQFRLHYVQNALQNVKQTKTLELSNEDRLFLIRIKNDLQFLENSFKNNETLLERLFDKVDSLDGQKKDGDALEKVERKLSRKVRDLRDDLRRHVEAAGVQVSADQRYAVWAGVALMFLALLVSLAATYGARRVLKPLKILVEGTKRIGSGDYAGRVIVKSQDELGVLAGEFNSMAAAVQEREQKLILHERLAVAGRLASHITHEVRNPLSSISLNTELLQEELCNLKNKGAQEAVTLCREIQKEVDRLTGITEQYLDFARLPKPNLAAEDINEVLGSLISFLAEELKEKKVEVHCHFQPNLGLIQADENQLRQAFLNLIRNAGQAMELKGGTLSISTSKKNGEIAIHFADTGLGIAPENINKIFEPFFSTKTRGTGLGLALTQQIVHEHGGRIMVESTVGKGTIVTVSLPAAGSRDKLAQKHE